MTADADYRKYCEGRLALTLAGGLAMQRALQGGAPGWRRLRSQKELIAFHEAGHALVATAVGFTVQTAFIVPPSEPDNIGFAGACVSSFTPDDPIESARPTHPKDMIRDSRQAAQLCFYLAGLANLIATGPTPTWRSALAYYREAKVRVRSIIDRQWYALVDLAEEIERRGTLNRFEVAGILAHNGL